MLNYDFNKTEQIVERLVNTESTLRIAIITGLTASLGILMFLMIGQARHDMAMVAGLLGAIIGGVLGKFATLLMSVVIEWMAQTLITQRDILEALKYNRK